MSALVLEKPCPLCAGSSACACSEVCQAYLAVADKFRLGVISSWEELDPVEEEDVAAGMAEITTLAEGGNPRASYILALAYTKGQGVKRDEVAAEKYMHRAANHGVASAQLNMGFICARKTTQGEGAAASSEKEENDASAVAWFEKAAEQRDATAALNLGIMHEQGRGVPKNPENSFKFHLAAAEGGVARAQHRIGALYFDGVSGGVAQQSDAEAFSWWTKAASQGNLDAQCSLGCMHLQGRGVGQSDAEAGKCFETAAEKGHAEAQFNLAFFFAEGRGVQRSESNARYLLGLAAAQGHASAQAMLKEMGPASKPGV